jgi:pilus assembly protein CpaC
VQRLRDGLILTAIVACGSILWRLPANGAEPIVPGQPPQATVQGQVSGQQAAPDAAAAGQAGAPGPTASVAKLVVTVGKSLIIDSPASEIKRLSVANGDLAEAVAVNPKEVLINGKMPGETSLIVWQQNGTRLIYDLTVRMSNTKLEAARQQIARDFPSEEINLTFENDTAFVRGTVHDVTAAERVMMIASTLGKTVNLLRVDIPPVEQQVVLKVKFANVDRAASTALGANFFTSAFNQKTAIGTGSLLSDGSGSLSIGTAVNILLQRPDINLAAAITALQSQRMLEMLAEPNLLAISGQQASFLAGGEFPFPIAQPSSGGSAITIMWREYGIRLNFQPNVTPRGTIRLKVAPEVSSLDYTNSVTVQGITIPGISSRRVQTEVELENQQSFVIAGLLDNQTTESFSKVPGIGSIPVLGKLFQNKTVNRNNSELLVIITPEVVRPIPVGQTPPELKFPKEMMPLNSNISMSNPGQDKTGPVPIKPPVDSLPVEQLIGKPGAPPPVGAGQTFQMIPVPAAPPALMNPNPGLAPTPAGAPGGPGK